MFVDLLLFLFTTTFAVSFVGCGIFRLCRIQDGKRLKRGKIPKRTWRAATFNQ